MRPSAVILGLGVVLTACGSNPDSAVVTSQPSTRPSIELDAPSGTTKLEAELADPAGTEVEPDDEDVVGTLAPAAAAPPAWESDPPYTVGIWDEYGVGLAAALEAERTETFAELIASADRIVLGVVSDVVAGRSATPAPNAPSSTIQFVTYIVDVVEDSDPGSEQVTFELPIRVTSDELLTAVQAAINPQDTNGNGVFDDDELAAGYDTAGVNQAYEDHWEAAVESTVAGVRERLPKIHTVFLLRQESSDAAYRPINGDATIVNDQGMARLPWRDGSGEARFHPVAGEVSAMTFADVVGVVFQR